MSEPTEIAFALVKYSDMEASPAFTLLCGITNVTVTENVETQDRRVRDCATPNKPGTLRTKVIGDTWSISGTGLTNADQRATIKDELKGKRVDYKVEYYRDDDTDAGELLGTDEGTAILDASTMSLDQEGESSLQINLKGIGELTYTAAP